MFTGIIKEVGTVKGINPLNGGKELTIDCSLAAEVQIDQSISINGVCHTVTERTADSFTVQSVEETLRKTNIGRIEVNDGVNLERSLRPDQLLDGHLVQGHVDGVGTIEDIYKEGTDYLFTISYTSEATALVVGRGSIAVDGISLTVADERENKFTIAVIPYTFEHTNLAHKSVGDRVNIEFDVLGKYVAKYMEQQSG